MAVTFSLLKALRYTRNTMLWHVYI